jgi:hypothetical protein
MDAASRGSETHAWLVLLETYNSRLRDLRIADEPNEEHVKTRPESARAYC